MSKKSSLIQPDIKQVNAKLVLIKKACDDNNPDQLKKILLETEAEWKQSPGKVCQTLCGKLTPDPSDIIFKVATTKQQTEMVESFGEAGFNLDIILEKAKIIRKNGASLNTHVARNYNLIRILLNFDADFNKLWVNNQNLLFQAAQSINDIYYFASIGITAADKQLHDWNCHFFLHFQQAYIRGKAFGDAYRPAAVETLLNLVCFSSISPLSAMVVDYMGKASFIPLKKFDSVKQEFVDSQDCLIPQTKRHQFFNSLEVKQTKTTYKAATLFNEWMTLYDPLNLERTHQQALLEWIREGQDREDILITNYQQFCQLSTILSHFYKTSPPAPETAFNKAYQASRQQYVEDRSLR